MSEGQNEASPEQLDAFEMNLIRVKAATLSKRGLIPRSEIEDVEQELSLAVLVAHGKVDLDPEKRHGLAYTVVRNAAVRLVRDRHYAKRNPYRVRSIGCEPEPVTEVDGPEMECEVDQRLDMADFLAELPEELRTLAELLKTRSVTEVAERLGLPRTTLYTGLRALRGRLSRAGFGKNLPQSADTSDTNGVITG